LRETYCSQQVVDTAVGLVETHRPELIEKRMEEEHWRQQAYSERAWDILEYLTEEKVEIPISLIGRMDLINEFTRRGRSAYGLPLGAREKWDLPHFRCSSCRSKMAPNI
jgi:hypothetical protein